MDRKKLLDILSNWMRAVQNDVNWVKTMLMPDDDISQLVFDVTYHPIDWCEIDVWDTQGSRVCTIIVDMHRIEYIWEGSNP